MGSTFSCLRVHIVFSTKERRPFIELPWRSQFHEYIGGTIRGLSGVPEAVGGVTDHVHLLVSYRPTLAISDFVRELKKATSVWARLHHEPQFEWQDGYAVFSVSASQRDSLIAYIGNQEDHHRHRSFREELEVFLRRHEIEFKPEYLD